MIRPPPWARMCGRTALVMRISPKTLMSNSCWSWTLADDVLDQGVHNALAQLDAGPVRQRHVRRPS